MRLIEKIKGTSPVYRSYNEDLIKLFTIKQGGKQGRSSETTKWEEAKYFSFVYEMYMYAILLGFKNNYQIDINDGESTKKFIEIKHWKPEEMADYIICAIFERLKIDLFKIENYDEKQLNEFVQNFKNEIESYANGGFEIIKDKRDEMGDLFKDSEYRFLELIEMSIKFNLNIIDL
ncbi:MAG: hypothetical protein WDZ80_07175 [Candidatus Paceibacterota bacterium]